MKTGEGQYSQTFGVVDGFASGVTLAGLESSRDFKLDDEQSAVGYAGTHWVSDPELSSKQCSVVQGNTQQVTCQSLQAHWHRNFSTG